jgi:prophage DNA circulation protein
MASFLKDTIGIGAAIQSADTVTFPKKGQYKGPSGRVSKFDFEDVESSISTKAVAFESASGDGTYIQPNGITGGRFPMNCCFHGTGHKERADAFTASLLESGVGLLTHPSYSRNIYVVPVGEINRSDPFVSGSGQTIISVQFYETTGIKIGDSKGLPQLYESFAESAALDFERSTKLSDPVDQASFKNRVRQITKTVSTALKKASGAVAKVNHAIEDTGDAINRGMDTMVGQPLALARQCQMLVSEPRRQKNLTFSKLDAYNNLAADIFARSVAYGSVHCGQRGDDMRGDRRIYQKA